jgi:hypothetical protein
MFACIGNSAPGSLSHNPLRWPPCFLSASSRSEECSVSSDTAATQVQVG